MAELTLYHAPTSYHMSANAIIYGTRKELEREGDQYSPSDPWFTVLHGTCVFNNGEESLPGAHDPKAERNKIELPLPLLTNEDRIPNEYGWCIGDIGIVTRDNALFKENSVVQLVDDDSSSCPFFCLVHGGETTLSHLKKVAQPYEYLTRIELPAHLQSPQDSQEATMTTPRNPFKKGDKVIATGFRNMRHGTDRHYYGTNRIMEEWIRDATVLTVTFTDDTRVKVNDDKNKGPWTFHFTEVRMATEDEASQTETQPKLVKGSIIKVDDAVGIVTHDGPDRDGDYRVFWISDTPKSVFLRVRGPAAQEFTLLGQVMEDGDFRATQVSSTGGDISQDTSTWKPGDKIRCGTANSSYLTPGKVYEIKSINHDADYLEIKAEDDGTSGRRSLNGVYDWVKVANA